MGKLASIIHLSQAETGDDTVIKIEGEPSLVDQVGFNCDGTTLSIVSTAQIFQARFFNRLKIQIFLPQEMTFFTEPNFIGHVYTRKITNTSLMIQHPGNFIAGDLSELAALFDFNSHAIVGSAYEVFFMASGHSSLKVDRADSSTMLTNHSDGKVEVNFNR